MVAALGVGLPFFIELPLALVAGLFVLRLLSGTTGRGRVAVIIALAVLAAVAVESALLALGAFAVAAR